MSKPLSEIFVDEYKELVEKLKEVGVHTDLDLSYKLDNGKYFHETFGYDIIDNEKIMTILTNHYKKKLVPSIFFVIASIFVIILCVVWLFRHSY